MPVILDKQASSHARGQSHGDVGRKGPNASSANNNGVLLLNTESMDRETANTSKLGGSTQKRGVSNPNSYVKVQNSEVASAGTADVMFHGGMPNSNNYIGGA